MLDVGFSEIVVIGVVALVVIGPEKLPRVARTAGVLLGRLQRHVAEVKADINREIQIDEMKRLQSEVLESAREIEQNMQSQARAIEQSVQPIAAEANAVADDLKATTALAHPQAEAMAWVSENKLPSAGELTPVAPPENLAAIQIPPMMPTLPEAAQPVPEEAVDDHQLDLFAAASAPPKS